MVQTGVILCVYMIMTFGLISALFQSIHWKIVLVISFGIAFVFVRMDYMRWLYGKSEKKKVLKWTDDPHGIFPILKMVVVFGFVYSVSMNLFLWISSYFFVQSLKSIYLFASISCGISIAILIWYYIRNVKHRRKI